MERIAYSQKNTIFGDGFPFMSIIPPDSSMKQKIFRKTYLLWFLGILSYALFYQAFYNLMDDKTVWPYANAKMAFDYILRNTVSIFAIFGAGWLIVFKFTNKSLSTPAKIIVDMCLAAVALIAFNTLYAFTLRIQFIDWVGTTFNSVMTMLALETAYYVEHYRKALEEREMLSVRLREYKYMALKQQVNPHFLFNSLNILYSMVRNSSDKSLEFIESLSNMYRYILRHQSSDLVTVEEEMEFVREYLNILSLRYVDQLKVTYDTPKGMPAKKVVPFTMQLLIENVVKHNVMTKTAPMSITIRIGDNEMSIANPKRPKNEIVEGGTGLKYLSQLYHIHGSKFKVHEDEEKFTAIVPLINA